MIQLQGIKKSFARPGGGRLEVLKGIDLSVKPGEFVAVVGSSGSGKSTLMNILGLLDQPDEGEYSLGGATVSGLNPTELARIRNRRIGFVFQQFHLLEAVTALDNVATGLLYRGVRRSHRRALAADALGRVGLSHRLDHRPPQMSGGERQRVAIARAIVGDPAIVLADELTGNLDSRSSAEIIGLLNRLNDDGSTIIVITHDRDLAASMPRRVTLSDGRIVDDSTGRA
jgi:putative ABC transport system ATP-binding protein